MPLNEIMFFIILYGIGIGSIILLKNREKEREAENERLASSSMKKTNAD